MSRRATLLATLLAAAAVFVPGAQTAAGQAGTPTLTASVGPGPTITLTGADGQPVTTLVEGTYTINVSDKSPNHNFHLFGADLNQTTTVPEVTDTSWTVTLKPGGYAFVCDPHQAQGMRGTFGVVAATRVAAPLDTRQVVGTATGRQGTGLMSGTIERSGDTATLRWQLTYSKLTGAAIAAHIHLGRPGRAGRILIPLCAPCRPGASGTTNVPAAALPLVLTGGTYVNVHTRRNPNGEIRGQLSVQG
jgi:plastocyanin